MFGVVCKKITFFKTNYKKKNTSLSLSHFGCRVNETQNQDPRPLLDSFRRYESYGGLRFGKQASVENRFFRGKLYCLDLREISITWYPELCFRN